VQQPPVVRPHATNDTDDIVTKFATIKRKKNTPPHVEGRV